MKGELRFPSSRLIPLNYMMLESGTVIISRDNTMAGIMNRAGGN